MWPAQLGDVVSCPPTRPPSPSTPPIPYTGLPFPRHRRIQTIQRYRLPPLASVMARSATAMAGGDVVVGPCPRAAPLAALGLLGAEPSSVRGGSQRTFGDPVANEGGEGHEAGSARRLPER